ncbi:unnamed protein product [Penicillium salamii]|nr:unnamed protein product [Penicillium salamii]CAG8317161.1 unnamed protein product [Penicillium salamii]CAG8324647.1 unnamed protein product [Penicillium salamii]
MLLPLTTGADAPIHLVCIVSPRTHFLQPDNLPVMHPTGNLPASNSTREREREREEEEGRSGERIYLQNVSDLAASNSTAPVSTASDSIALVSTVLPNIDLNHTVTLTNPSVRRLSQAVTRIKRIHSNPKETKPPTNYLFASDIDEDTFERLWSDCRLFHGTTVTLWRSQRAALYRIMPNHQHEHFCQGFASIMIECLLQMHLSFSNRDFEPSGSERIRGVSTSKEPDWAFRPGPIPSSGHSPPPSLILEVGVSESYSYLLGDVQWWSTNAPVRPGMVVVIHATSSPPFRVVIEVWQDCAFDTQHNTRIAPHTRFQRDQRIEIEGRVIRGGPLRLDFALLIRREPNPPIERDVEFTNQELLVLAARCY